MTQKPTISFSEIRWRKRADRAVQLAILGTSLAFAARIATRAVGFGVRWMLTRAPPALLAAPALAAVAGVVQLARSQRVGMRGDVADVLASQTNSVAKGGEPGSQAEGTGGTRRGY